MAYVLCYDGKKTTDCIGGQHITIDIACVDNDGKIVSMSFGDSWENLQLDYRLKDRPDGLHYWDYSFDCHYCDREHVTRMAAGFKRLDKEMRRVAKSVYSPDDFAGEVFRFAHAVRAPYCQVFGDSCQGWVRIPVQSFCDRVRRDIEKHNAALAAFAAV